MASIRTQTARVPAWKRLGLQLKNQNALESKKRTFDDTFSHEKSDVKKELNEASQDIRTVVSGAGSPKKRKSVAFSHDTKQDDGNDTEHQLTKFITENTGGENG